MSKPRILRITRPYESVEDYVQSEGWTISTKRMILLDQPRLDRDTLVRFELSLQGGQKLIRAEARVVGYQTATPDKPGGPKVRFKRFGGTTKAFIQQVVAEHGPGPGLETQHPSSPASSDSGAPSESPMSLRFSDPAASDEPQHSAFVALEARALQQANLAGLAAIATALSGDARQRLQQLARKEVAHGVAAPQNRNALLDKLRQRACADKRRESPTQPSLDSVALG